MSQTKHTPGPWAVRPQEFDDWGLVRGPSGQIVAKAGGGISVDEANLHRANNTDPFEANARLIAAAPEMYASLKTMLDGFEEGIFVRNVHGDEKGDWAMKLIPFLAALGKAQAAIAKVEGL